MLRPLVAFGALALAAFLLAPTVLSVHEGVEEQHIIREFPWQLWKWGQKIQPPDIIPPDCDQRDEPLYSEVTKWPERILKNATFEMGGIVNAPGEQDRGIFGVRVDLFLNETKSEPGIFLGQTRTDAAGNFLLNGTFPYDLQATKYHLVAHAHTTTHGCVDYLEHWSDPEMEVTSPTRIEWDLPRNPVVGHETAISGWLLDAVGGPVREADVELILDGGRKVDVETDANGRFTLPWTPEDSGNITVEAEYDGNKYYSPAKADETLKVLDEDVVLRGVPGDTVELLRGQPTELRGQVFLAKGREPGTMTLDFDGIKVKPCAACEASSSIEVTPDDEGNFTAWLLVGPDQPLGPFEMVFRGGGLDKGRAYEGAAYGTIALTVESSATNWFAEEYEARVTAHDDTGAPAVGMVAVEGPDGWREVDPDEQGQFSYVASAECGSHPVRAVHNGTDYLRPAIAQSEVSVCPWMAFVPPFLFAVPWWGWALIVTGLAAAYFLGRRLHDRYATVIARGPPLALAFSEPSDAAAGIVGVGEAATITVYLEEALPEGYALRVGTFRRLERVEPGPDLRASWTLVPDKLGDFAIRGEIVDRKGRVVTRRTSTLRVVKYAQEIESRHLALRRATMGDEAGPVTPREFQRWLVQRAPGLDPVVARRLVRLFEEADYGPRDVGRRELLAYIEAEAAVPEVMPDASSH